MEISKKEFMSKNHFKKIVQKFLRKTLKMFSGKEKKCFPKFDKHLNKKLKKYYFTIVFRIFFLGGDFFYKHLDLCICQTFSLKMFKIVFDSA